MANCRLYWRSAFIAAALLVTVPAPFQDRVVAQDNGSRPADDRGNRPGRGWRRGGGPGGNGDRGRAAGDNSRPAEARPAVPTPAAAPSSTSFGTISEAEKIRQRASEMIKQHDKSGNGILEGDELADLGMSRGADKDGDGKITYDELVAFYSPKSAGTSTAQPVVRAKAEPKEASEQPAAGAAQRKIVNTSRKSYRFKSAKERLATWRFASQDANGDGQVSMSEYARTWTDRTAAEFQRYDRNNDGMITPAEAK